MSRVQLSTLGSVIKAAFEAVGGTYTFSGPVSVDDTTDSTSTTTGSVHTDGGLGVAKASFFGDDITLTGSGRIFKILDTGSNASHLTATIGNLSGSLVVERPGANQGYAALRYAGNSASLALQSLNGTEFTLTKTTGGDVIASGNMILASGKGIDFNFGPEILSGTGTPEGAVTAAIGSMYLRADGGAGTSMYIKESGTGNTGWAAK